MDSANRQTRIIRAVLFDLDGTLTDTEAIHFDCWNQLLAGYGVSLSGDDYYKNYSGVSMAEIARRLIERFGIPEQVPGMVARREALYLRHVATAKIPLMPFAAEMIEWITDKDIPLGLVTSGSADQVEQVLSKGVLPRSFKAIVTRDDVQQCKPDPEPYLKAAGLLGFGAHEYLVLEDTFSGVRSATSAGLYCFGVQSNPEEAEKLRTITDHVFANLREVRNFLAAGESFSLARR